MSIDITIIYVTLSYVSVKDKCDLPDAHTKMQEINAAWQTFQSYDPNQVDNENEREANGQNYQNRYEEEENNFEDEFEVYKRYLNELFDREIEARFEREFEKMRKAALYEMKWAASNAAYDPNEVIRGKAERKKKADDDMKERLNEEKIRRLDPKWQAKQELIHLEQSAMNKLYQILGCKKTDTKDEITKIYNKKIQASLKVESNLKNDVLKEQALVKRKELGGIYGEVYVF